MANIKMRAEARKILQEGLVIPACPLALDAQRKFDERHQRALVRYYAAAGAGGLAVGVHTTQFQIRDPAIGLFKPVLEVAIEEMKRIPKTFVRIGGICGSTRPAAEEAGLLASLGYDAALLSLGAMKTASDDELMAHCRAIAEIIPIIGFYLQPAAGGRLLSYAFWRQLAEIENVVAIKIAPFNRYQTLDVVRAVAEAGRPEIALYTGNDDNIVLDLLTPYRFGSVERRIVGGLLGHWAVWTQRAVELLQTCHELVRTTSGIPQDMLRLGVEVTDANAAIFDAANAFAGCIPGINEMLRRQGLLQTNLTLDPNETLSAGQSAELDRIQRSYPHISDDEFVQENMDDWLSN
jgi:dihydrodipicolinate synthase/N-acetylneuraminate lyase